MKTLVVVGLSILLGIIFIAYQLRAPSKTSSPSVHSEMEEAPSSLMQNTLKDDLGVKSELTTGRGA